MSVIREIESDIRVPGFGKTKRMLDHVSECQGSCIPKVSVNSQIFHQESGGWLKICTEAFAIRYASYERVGRRPVSVEVVDRIMFKFNKDLSSHKYNDGSKLVG